MKKWEKMNKLINNHVSDQGLFNEFEIKMVMKLVRKVIRLCS